MIPSSNTGLKYMGIENAEDGRDAEENDVWLFIDTGANVNTTMSRRQFIAFLDENLDLDYLEGPFGGLEVKLVSGQTLQAAGDKVRIQTEVTTTMGKVRGLGEFLILDNDVEDIVIGVY